MEREANSSCIEHHNTLEPAEYDQTYDLVDENTLDTQQSHQSAFIAQLVHKATS